MKASEMKYLSETELDTKLYCGVVAAVFYHIYSLAGNAHSFCKLCLRKPEPLAQLFHFFIVHRKAPLSNIFDNSISHSQKDVKYI